MMNNNMNLKRYWNTVQKKNAPDAQKNPLTLNRFLIIKPAQKKKLYCRQYFLRIPHPLRQHNLQVCYLLKGSDGI